MSKLVRKSERAEDYDAAGEPIAPHAAGAEGMAPPPAAGAATGAGAGSGKHGYIPYGVSPASGPAPTTAGPHRHDFMNKLDPRVDSSTDKEPMVASTVGHNSKIANVLDPRVDSSVANDPAVETVPARRHPGPHYAGAPPAAAAATEAGHHHGHHHQTAGVATETGHHHHGHHQHAAGAQPGTGAYTGAGGGVGAGAGYPGQAPPYETAPTGVIASETAPSTTGATNGPHKSSLLNKLDPAVDSKTGEVRGSLHPAPAAPTTMGTLGTGAAPGTARY